MRQRKDFGEMSKGGRYLQQKQAFPSKKWRNTILIVLAAVLLIAGLGGWFVISKMNRIQRAQIGENQLTEEKLASLLVQDPTQAVTETTVPPATTVPRETEPGYGKMGKVINVLLIGQDAREGEDSKNADTVLLVTVNKETKKITLTSFLRDTYISLNGIVDPKGKPYSGSTKLTLSPGSHAGIGQRHHQ